MDQYLIDHPTAMPAREAAMTYLFTSEPVTLRLIAGLEESYTAADETQETALTA